MQAMIFAAGLGTRLKPLTDTKPKALIEVGNKTLLEHNIEKLILHNIRNIVVNVHHFADMVISECKNLETKYDCNIIISNESEDLLDTGGGLINAEKLFYRNNPMFLQKNLTKNDNNCILVHNVDILSDVNFSELQSVFLKSNCIALLVVQNRKTSRYLIFNEKNELSGWTNLHTNQKIITRKCKKEKLFAFNGIHIINSDIFKKNTLQGKFSIVDMYLQLSENNIIKPYIHQGFWLDVGKMASLKKANELF